MSGIDPKADRTRVPLKVTLEGEHGTLDFMISHLSGMLIHRSWRQC